MVENAYRALKTAVRDNVFPPGYQGSEQEIALRLGMSRTPVHEALIRLQEEGLVRVLPKRGIQVCALSPDDMREIYDLVATLEGRAAEAIAAGDAALRTRALDALDAINADMRAALDRDDLDAWAQADDRFHRALVERCGNRRLARAVGTVMDQSHRARMVTLRLRVKPIRSLKEHLAVTAAIRKGDAPRAGALARAHREHARDELLPLLETLGMRHL
ncbi:GntR family transcriptional regulator [Rhodoplanes sp. TEM]|uniref:GntR family transcriptional regulator n=1 Tax=Rhodoplanes tepidamans TaxID=200616 RepID=A0ABT5JFN1_RHOTP|nr:GntR family transcriptional regulator [Rhodoplanes tepidamans]MDC7788514.1 GntR family transcriptional regulator [Rhodoplanes tepidamans]MDC7985113.1 GntR family transcriptional regulator [Rhodoplanes sp. TEM]